MALLAADLFQYLRDTSFFGQSDDKAIRQQVDVINRSLQYAYANSNLKRVEEYGRVTIPAASGARGVNATSGSATLTFSADTAPWRSGESAHSGQYITIEEDDRLYLIQEVTSTTGLLLHSDYPYIGSGVTSGSYTIWPAAVALPSGLETMDNPKDDFYIADIPYLTPQEWLSYVRNNGMYRGAPYRYTIMNNQITNKLSMFLWPCAEQVETMDFRYWRYPATINSSSDSVDWPEEDLWVLKSIMDFFSLQYMNFGEDPGDRMKWYQIKKSEAEKAMATLKNKNFRRVDLGYVGRTKSPNNNIPDMRYFRSEP